MINLRVYSSIPTFMLSELDLFHNQGIFSIHNYSILGSV